MKDGEMAKITAASRVQIVDYNSQYDYAYEVGNGMPDLHDVTPLGISDI